MSVELAKQWLSNSACPLWLKTGLDTKQGGFYENLSLEGKPLSGTRRVMVQARQIFSAHMAMQLGILPQAEAKKAIQHGIDFVLKYYSLPSGAFAHAIDEKFHPVEKPEDLYAQSFALFGLAHAFAVLKDEKYLLRAQELMAYLYRERSLKQGGFSELLGKGVQYEANPHMHLFEAVLYWMEIDKSPLWKKAADEIYQLCAQRFIDHDRGLLAEHFDESWRPLLVQGKYVFEPGHHYEWVWLLGRYQKLAGQDLRDIRQKLYDVAERHGICPIRKTSFDEVWSDLSPAKKTTRFWPQCERIKAALQLAQESGENGPYVQSADEALMALFKFLDVPVKGVWYDTWEESGEFTLQPAKASSFYHIIGAMTDYMQIRPTL